MILSWEVLPESDLREAIGVLVRVVETAGAVIIFVGAVWAFARFLAALAGDVLRTAVAPSLTEIGQLAAIAP